MDVRFGNLNNVISAAFHFAYSWERASRKITLPVAVELHDPESTL